MTPRAELNFLALLHLLSENKVDFIIVGGVCAVLHGAPLATFDLDLVPSLDPKNLDRFHSCLIKLHAIYRGRGDQKIEPERSHLTHAGHMLLETDYGPLDVLGYIGSGWDYEKLSKHSELLDCEGMKLRILDLPTLIQIKEETAREKDKAALFILRSIQKEKGK